MTTYYELGIVGGLCIGFSFYLALKEAKGWGWFLCVGLFMGWLLALTSHDNVVLPKDVTNVEANR